MTGILLKSWIVANMVAATVAWYLANAHPRHAVFAQWLMTVAWVSSATNALMILGLLVLA